MRTEVGLRWERQTHIPDGNSLLSPRVNVVYDIGTRTSLTENQRRAEVAVLRILGGLKSNEVAEAMGCAKRAVERDWTAARAFLISELSGASNVFLKAVEMGLDLKRDSPEIKEIRTVLELQEKVRVRVMRSAVQSKYEPGKKADKKAA